MWFGEERDRVFFCPFPIPAIRVGSSPFSVNILNPLLLLRRLRRLALHQHAVLSRLERERFFPGGAASGMETWIREFLRASCGRSDLLRPRLQPSPLPSCVSLWKSVHAETVYGGPTG